MLPLNKVIVTWPDGDCRIRVYKDAKTAQFFGHLEAERSPLARVMVGPNIVQSQTNSSGEPTGTRSVARRQRLGQH